MEPVYDVAASDNGRRGEILSNPKEIGQKVFVCDSKDGTVYRTTIIRRWWDDKRQDSNSNNNKSHLAVIVLPPDWIGKKVHIRPFEIVRM
jgi:hypothetical protein